MLRNDPPPGTKVKFVRAVKEAKESDIATLVEPLKKYDEDNPTDLFYVRFREKRVLVYRRDIEEV